MRCEECDKFIWYWNDWRNKGVIVIDTRHPKYMLTIHLCSEKCYLKYSIDWLVKRNNKQFDKEMKKARKKFKKEITKSYLKDENLKRKYKNG